MLCCSILRHKLHWAYCYSLGLIIHPKMLASIVAAIVTLSSSFVHCAEFVIEPGSKE